MKQQISPAVAAVIVAIVVVVLGFFGYKYLFTRQGIDAPPPKNQGRSYMPPPSGAVKPDIAPSTPGGGG